MRVPAHIFERILANADAPAAGHQAWLGPERRRAGRCMLPARAGLCRVRGRIIGSPEFVRVRDISPIGICLLHTRPIEPGERFILALNIGGGATACLQFAANRSWEREPGVYVIGAGFRGLFGREPVACGAAECPAHHAPASQQDAAPRASSLPVVP